MKGAAVLPHEFSRHVSELLVAPGHHEGALATESTSQFEASSGSAAAAVGTGGPFVVDAHSIVLRPGVRERVRLRLCATTCGTLRITGARWRLFGEVGGMHQLVRPGPLLHASREIRLACATLFASLVNRQRRFVAGGSCGGGHSCPMNGSPSAAV